MTRAGKGPARVVNEVAPIDNDIPPLTRDTRVLVPRRGPNHRVEWADRCACHVSQGQDFVPPTRLSRARDLRTAVRGRRLSVPAHRRTRFHHL